MVGAVGILLRFERQQFAVAQGFAVFAVRFAVEEVAAAEPEHPLLVALRDTNPDALTPLEALKRITEWKLLWGAPKQ